ncbi:MAG: cobalt transporter CbiM [Pseudomonadota bacterium]
MHISEGVLSPSVLIAGAVLTAAGCWIGYRKLQYEKIVTASVLSATFFVGSLIHVPLGPSSVHLLLNGISGVVLGWVAFPCILVALLLQAVMFQFGGLSVLGVNTLNVAVPAVLCFYLLRPLLAGSPGRAALAGFLGGAGAVLGTALMTAFSLAFTDEGFLTTAKLVVVGHLPVMVIEGVVTMFAVGFLARVRPELLSGGGCLGHASTGGPSC